MPADQAPWVALDFETTGLDFEAGHRVIEVGVVRVEPQTHRRQELSTLIYPGGPIALRSQNIHGIRDEMVDKAPVFTDVLPRIRPLLEDAVLLAHNAPFDMGFLAAECERADLELPAIAVVVDTLQVARHVFHLPDCRLGAIAHRIGLPLHDAHRALADARATVAIFREMIHHITPGPTPTVGDLLDTVERCAEAPRIAQDVREQLEAAKKNGHQIEIDYISYGAVGALTMRRPITVLKVKSRKVDAYCHLREARRTFRIERIRNVVPLDRASLDPAPARPSPRPKT